MRLVYQCKYKNSKILQRYIIDNYEIYWRGHKDVIDINTESENADIKDNDLIYIFYDRFLTYDFEPFSKIYKEAIDFEPILREQKLKRIIEE